MEDLAQIVAELGNSSASAQDKEGGEARVKEKKRTRCRRQMMNAFSKYLIADL